MQGITYCLTRSTMTTMENTINLNKKLESKLNKIGKALTVRLVIDIKR